MKRIILALLGVVMFTSLAYAEWKVTFEDTYLNKGIDQAVQDALKEGGMPTDIMGLGVTLEGLNPQNLVMALYCAGVKGDDVLAAAKAHDISEQIVTAGYKKAVTECSDALADSQAYTPVAQSFFRAGVATSGGTVSASPTTF